MLQAINVSAAGNSQRYIGMSISAVQRKMSDLRQSDSVIAKDFFDNKDENNEFRI
jgi:hypothetical protein